MRISHLPIAGLFLRFGASLVCAGTLDPNEVLDRYEQNLKSNLETLKRCEFRVEMRVVAHGRVFSDDGVGKSEETILCRHDGEKWYFGHDSNSHSVLQGKTINGKSSSEQIFTDRRSMIVQRGDDAKVEAVVRREISDRNDLTPEKYGEFMLIFGYLPDAGNEAWIPDFLRHSTLSASTTILNGRAADLLEAVNPYGVYKFWLDPAVGYLPRRIEVRKTDGHLTKTGAESKPVRSIPGLRSLSRVIDRFEIERLGERFLIRSYVSNRNTRYSDHVDTMEYVTKITDLTLNPTFTKDSFSPSRPIPDGTPVQVEEAPSIRYEWRGGEVVKVVDKNAINRLGGLSFARERPWRMLAQAGLCVLVLFALGWRLARRGRA